MKAFILAAGEGTRMRPLTSNMSKSLLPIAGKPFLEHTLAALKANKITDVVILIGYKGRDIQRHFRDGKKFGMNITYVRQKDRLGTGHATGLAATKIEEPFISINGDVVVTAETIKKILANFKRHGDMVITGSEVDNPRDFGIIETKKDCMECLTEKPENPKTNIANAGIYVYTPEIFDYIKKTELSPRGEYEITDSISMVVEDGRKVRCVIMEEDWIDVGRPWDLLKANSLLMKDLKEDIKGEVQPYVTIEGPVIIGKGTIVKNGAYIVGPVIIGENSEIGPNCLIRPSTYIGNRCKVGNASELKNTILMDGSKAPHHNYIGDSIIGRNCNFGSGTKVANLRLDKKNIIVNLKGRRVDTGTRKLGVIAGDDVQTGINATIDPGTIIGEKSFIGPGAIVGGNIAPKSKIH